MDVVRVVGYVVLAGVAPVTLLCVVMLRGVLPRRAKGAQVIELHPADATEPQRVSRSM